MEKQRCANGQNQNQHLIWEQDKTYLIQIQLRPNNEGNAKTDLALNIVIKCVSKNTEFKGTYDNSNLSNQAKTIFYDVDNMFDYIREHHQCRERIYFQFEEGTLKIINIVRMKSKQIKQEINLQLTRGVIQSKNNVNPCKSSSKIECDMFQFTDLKQQQYMGKLQCLMEGFKKFQEQIMFLKQNNTHLMDTMNTYNATVSQLQFSNCELTYRVEHLQKKLEESNQHQKQFEKNQNKQNVKSQIPKMLQQEVNSLKKKVDENSWHIEQINIQMLNKIQEEKQKQDPLHLVNTLKKNMIILNSKVQSLGDSSRLGEKVFVAIDFHKNQHMVNYRIIENIVQKISGDQKRFQILGQDVVNKPYKSHYQVKIISSVNGGVILGVVCNSRRGERYSYDKKQCVCYDGKGFIFQQGQKIKMPCKFDNGQTVRVVLDPKEGIIQWFVGYTQIGSTHIPQSLKKSSLVPYIQMYDINDKIAING